MTPKKRKATAVEKWRGVTAQMRCEVLEYHVGVIKAARSILASPNPVPFVQSDEYLRELLEAHGAAIAVLKEAARKGRLK